VRGQGRAYRLRRRAEQDEAAVLQDEREAEGENELRVMPFALGSGDADAGHARNQEAVKHVADGEQRRARKQRAGIGTGDWPQEPQHVEADDEVEGEVHAEHQELALSEIDDAHHAEDDSKADAHQAVNCPDQEASDERLEKNFDESSERCHFMGSRSARREIRNKGETVRKYSIGAAPLTPEAPWT